MARKSQRIRLKRRLSRLQEKLAASGQLKQQSNSDAIEEMKASQLAPVAKQPEEVKAAEPEPAPEPVIEEVEEEIEEVKEMVEELMTTQIIEELPLKPEKLAAPMDLMKLKKAELLIMADAMGCNVTSKNTKKQIIAAIEKQSA